MRSKGQCAAYFVFLLSYLKPVFSLCSIIFCLKSQVSSLKTTLAHCRLLLPTFSWLQKFLTEPSRYTEEKEAGTLRVWVFNTTNHEQKTENRKLLLPTFSMRSKGQGASYFIVLLSYLKRFFSLCSIIYSLISQVSYLQSSNKKQYLLQTRY